MHTLPLTKSHKHTRAHTHTCTMIPTTMSSLMNRNRPCSSSGVNISYSLCGCLCHGACHNAFADEQAECMHAYMHTHIVAIHTVNIMHAPAALRHDARHDVFASLMNRSVACMLISIPYPYHHIHTHSKTYVRTCAMMPVTMSSLMNRSGLVMSGAMLASLPLPALDCCGRWGEGEGDLCVCVLVCERCNGRWRHAPSLIQYSTPVLRCRVLQHSSTANTAPLP